MRKPAPARYDLPLERDDTARFLPWIVAGMAAAALALWVVVYLISH